MKKNKTIFFKDDIIEVLNLREHEDQRYTIGYRYRVENGSYGSTKDQINVYNPGCQVKITYINHNQIMLYHRSFKNRIKSLFK